MTAELPAKRVKTTPPLIGTHNGHFHADEALAVYLLRLLPTYHAAPLVRTRDPAVLDSCHTVVDVGGAYDDTLRRYDHHQRGFDAFFPDRTVTPLSSAGLVWLHFGRQVIAARTGLEPASETVGVLWNKLYSDFVEAVDANDNGVAAYDASVAGEARFKTHGVTLASLVGDLNHPLDLAGTPGVPDHEQEPAGKDASLEAIYAATANAPSTTTDGVPAQPHPQAAEDARFHRASALMGTAFLRKLHALNDVWLPARAVVAEAFHRRRALDPQGRILEMSGGGVPWKEHLYALEEEEAASSAPGGSANAPAPEQSDAMVTDGTGIAANALGMSNRVGANAYNELHDPITNPNPANVSSSVHQNHDVPIEPPQTKAQAHAASNAAAPQLAAAHNATQFSAAVALLESKQEAELDAVQGTGKVSYVLYPEKADDPSSKWRVQAVPVTSGSFQSRTPLPESWRGLRDAALSAASGIDGGVFVHASGFIGGNATRAGALDMARKSLDVLEPVAGMPGTGAGVHAEAEKKGHVW